MNEDVEIICYRCGKKYKVSGFLDMGFFHRHCSCGAVFDLDVEFVFRIEEDLRKKYPVTFRSNDQLDKETKNPKANPWIEVSCPKCNYLSEFKCDTFYFKCDACSYEFERPEVGLSEGKRVEILQPNTDFCPRCGNVSMPLEGTRKSHCCTCCNYIFFKLNPEVTNKNQKEKKMPNFPKEITSFKEEVLICPNCKRLFFGISEKTMALSCGGCGTEIISEGTIVKKTQKEKKMLKAISGTYEKTSDAILVDKHFGLTLNSGPFHEVIVKSLKKEILEKAKELEAKEKEKND